MESFDWGAFWTLAFTFIGGGTFLKLVELWLGHRKGDQQWVNDKYREMIEEERRLVEEERKKGSAIQAYQLTCIDRLAKSLDEAKLLLHEALVREIHLKAQVAECPTKNQSVP